MNSKKRVLIVVNKYWECDPVSWVLTNFYLNECCGVETPFPELVTYPSYGPVKSQPPVPRLKYEMEAVVVEVWCISDLLSVFPNTPQFQSSSQRKMEVMKGIFTYSDLPIALVVAVGTASSGPFCPTLNDDVQSNINGSVVVGSRIFMHDGHPATDPNPYSELRCNYFDQLMNSSIYENTIPEMVNTDSLTTALLCPPLNPATNGQNFYISYDYVAIGDINVTDYKEYPVKDKEAGSAFIQNYPDNVNAVSLETTHGLIYATARNYFDNKNPPFLFISGIVDRYCMFNLDVSSRVYAQNVTGAHNAGIVVAELVSGVNKNVLSGKIGVFEESK